MLKSFYFTKHYFLSISSLLYYFMHTGECVRYLWIRQNNRGKSYDLVTVNISISHSPIYSSPSGSLPLSQGWILFCVFVFNITLSFFLVKRCFENNVELPRSCKKSTNSTYIYLHILRFIYIIIVKIYTNYAYKHTLYTNRYF